MVRRLSSCTTRMGPHYRWYYRKVNEYGIADVHPLHLRNQISHNLWHAKCYSTFNLCCANQLLRMHSERSIGCLSHLWVVGCHGWSPRPIGSIPALSQWFIQQRATNRSGSVYRRHHRLFNGLSELRRLTIRVFDSSLTVSARLGFSWKPSSVSPPEHQSSYWEWRYQQAV